MTSMMANYAPDSEEYKTLYYRVQCGQAQQQAEIQFESPYTVMYSKKHGEPTNVGCRKICG